MDNKTLSGNDFIRLLKKGYEALSSNYEAINDLNVFPVPDGDTGTNMKMTFAGGLRSIVKSDDLGSLATDFARGSLFAARGNSGVLSSQYYKGIADGLKNKKDADVPTFAKAMVNGYKVAYSAAADPVEGTILTVGREGIENVINHSKNLKDFPTFFAAVVEAMKASLDNTPNLLPVLKEAGVVDSGGKGLLTIFQGFLGAYTGKEESSSEIDTKIEESFASNTSAPVDYSAFNENSVLDYGYCTEFLLQLLSSKTNVKRFSIKRFIAWLEEHGNSIVCFQTGTVIKVHVHTKKPYEVIRYAQKYGEFVAFKMENMALQHNEVIIKEEKKKKERVPSAIIAIGQGEGIKDLYHSLGADIVLDGGKTMNASTEEIIDAAKYANAEDVILLPNESNILLAAKQAQNLYKKCRIHVVETKNLVEGYIALSMLVDKNDVQGTIDAFNEAIKSLDYGFVALSNRDIEIEGETVPSHTYIGGINKEILASGLTAEMTLDSLLSYVKGLENKSALLLIRGKATKEENANQLLEALKNKYPDLEIGLLSGEQEVYDYLVGIY